MRAAADAFWQRRLRTAVGTSERTAMTVELGRFGIWQGGQNLSPELAAGVEKLGFGTVWIGSSPSGELRLAERLLEATTRIAVGTSIVNVWKDAPELVAESYHRVEERFPGDSCSGSASGIRNRA